VLFAQSIKTGDAPGVWGAMHLMIPPLALLITLDLPALALGSLAWLTGYADLWPVLVLGGVLGLAGISLLLAWRAGGSRFVTAASLVKFPLYLAWKLPMYFRFAAQGAPKEWIRTARKDD